MVIVNYSFLLFNRRNIPPIFMAIKIMQKVFLLFSGLTLSVLSNAQSLYLERNNIQPIEQQLSENLYELNADNLNTLLQNYKSFSEYNQRLADFASGRIAFLKNDYSKAISMYRKVLAENPTLTAVRLELAITLFYQKQTQAAKEQFEKVKSDSDLPKESRLLVEHYLEEIASQNSWDINFSINYIHDKNVNNVASTEHISLSNHATLTKSGRLLPQEAHGFAYYLNIAKDFNLFASHYLSINNQLWGKNYWDNHQYDDIFNRTSIGYAYKTAQNTFRIKPFYEKRWYGNESYRWNNGVRLENAYWLNPHWQVSLSFEWATQHYFEDTVLNGHNKQYSTTFLWIVDPKRFFYFGGDVFNERVKIRQYGSNSKAIRFGWGQEWQWGISTQLGLSFLTRKYKDIAKLGNLDFFSFGKTRKDHIYSLNLMLWKRDWHWWGITPKLQLMWKKQASNIPEMYSYKQNNINLVFEKRF